MNDVQSWFVLEILWIADDLKYFSLQPAKHLVGNCFLFGGQVGGILGFKCWLLFSITLAP